MDIGMVFANYLERQVRSCPASCRENARSLVRSHEAVATSDDTREDDQEDVAANGSGNNQTANIVQGAGSSVLPRSPIPGLGVYDMHDQMWSREYLLIEAGPDHQEANPWRNGSDGDLEAARSESAESIEFRPDGRFRLTVFYICYTVRSVLSKWIDVACDGIHWCLQILKDVPLIVAGIMMTGTATAFPLMTYNDRKNAALLYG
jgi:hypothetical protein